MNWITNFVKPKIQALIKRDIPDNLWDKCPSCERMLFRKDLINNLSVCEHCEYHFKITPFNRAQLIFDSFDRIHLKKKPIVDPLKFKDSKKYSDRLKDYRQKTSEEDAFQAFYGHVDKIPLTMGVLNFSFMGGSMGCAVGNGFVESVDHALSNHHPFLIVTSSGGARMQEGLFSLMQMPRTILSIQKLKKASLPYIVLLTDPTTGGVSASFAMLGDIHLAEPQSMIGFAGARVIEETIKQKLPDGFQRAEYLKDHGMVDMVVHRSSLKNSIKNILICLHGKNI